MILLLLARDGDDGQHVDVLRLGGGGDDSHHILARGSSHKGNHLHGTTTATTNTLNDKVVVQVEERQGDEGCTEGLGRSNRESLLVLCSFCPGKASRTSQLAGQLSPDYKEPHLGRGRQYWRDIMLGVNDGAFLIYVVMMH
jgi:hypothetical protein